MLLPYSTYSTYKRCAGAAIGAWTVLCPAFTLSTVDGNADRLSGAFRRAAQIRIFGCDSESLFEPEGVG